MKVYVPNYMTNKFLGLSNENCNMAEPIEGLVRSISLETLKEKIKNNIICFSIPKNRDYVVIYIPEYMECYTISKKDFDSITEDTTYVVINKVNQLIKGIVSDSLFNTYSTKFSTVAQYCAVRNLTVNDNNTKFQYISYFIDGTLKEPKPKQNPCSWDEFPFDLEIDESEIKNFPEVERGFIIESDNIVIHRKDDKINVTFKYNLQEGGYNISLSGPYRLSCSLDEFYRDGSKFSCYGNKNNMYREYQVRNKLCEIFMDVVNDNVEIKQETVNKRLFSRLMKIKEAFCSIKKQNKIFEFTLSYYGDFSITNVVGANFLKMSSIPAENDIMSLPRLIMNYIDSGAAVLISKNSSYATYIVPSNLTNTIDLRKLKFDIKKDQWNSYLTIYNGRKSYSMCIHDENSLTSLLDAFGKLISNEDKATLLAKYILI